MELTVVAITLIVAPIVAALLFFLFAFLYMRASTLNSHIFNPDRSFVDATPAGGNVSDFIINKKIPCRLVRSESQDVNENRKLFIYSYNADGSIERSRAIVGDLSERLVVDYLVYEYPGYGKDYTSAVLSMTEHKFNLRLRTVVNEMVKGRGYRMFNIFLHGFSMGSGPSTAVAAYFSKRKESLGGLVLQSPFLSLRDAVYPGSWFLSSIYMPDRWNNAKLIPKVACPILILDGKTDSDLSDSRATLLRDKSKQNLVTLTLIAATWHQDHTKEVGTAIHDWLNAIKSKIV